MFRASFVISVLVLVAACADRTGGDDPPPRRDDAGTISQRDADATDAADGGDGGVPLPPDDCVGDHC